MCWLRRSHDPTLMWYGYDDGRIIARLGCRRCRQPLVWGNDRANVA